MYDQIRVLLADQYDLVVGDTFQLFYRSVIEAPNPYFYSIVTVCEKGKNFPRYFEYTPQEEGRHTLTISVYDAQKKLLGTATTTLNVVIPKQPKRELNVMCLGDSNMAKGVWVSEVNRRISGIGGNPEGHGIKGVNFVGSVTSSDGTVHYEGSGGWTWKGYTSTSVGSILVKAPNNKTERDQHSLWKDENGYVWQLESLQVDYLGFTRYKDHNGPRPEKGILTHYKNANDTSPIEFFGSFDGSVSPFLDRETKTISIKKYLDKINVKNIDVAYLYLGGNGLMRQSAMNKSRREYCNTVVREEALELINLIKKDIPSVKIKLVSMALPSINGGMGSNYGAEIPFTDCYDIIHYVMELNLMYKNLAKEDKYKDFIEYVDSAAQFDLEYSYPNIQKPVNVRSSTTERFDTNALHPTFEGNMLIADSFYRNLIRVIGEIE